MKKFYTQEAIEDYMYTKFFEKNKLDSRYINIDMLYSAFQSSYVVGGYIPYTIVNNDYLNCHKV